MKRKLSILLVMILALSFTLVSASAATVVDRVVVLEQAIGLEAGTDALIARIEYLETQLGVAAAAGATIEDRVAALEAVLGLAPAAEEAEAVMYKDSTPLTSIGYFSQDGYIYEYEVGETSFDTDNYGNVYSSLIYGKGQSSTIDYLLGGEYKEFTASIYVTGKAIKEGLKSSFWDTATVSIYGDDVLLYQITGFDAKDEPLPISVNVEGVKFLKIEFSKAVYGYSDFNSGNPLVALGDPAVVK